MSAWAIALAIFVGSFLLVLLFCFGIAYLIIVCTRNKRRKRTIVCPDVASRSPGDAYIYRPETPPVTTQSHNQWASQRRASENSETMIIPTGESRSYQPSGPLATIEPPTYSATIEKENVSTEPPPYQDVSPKAPQREDDASITESSVSGISSHVA